MSLPSLRLRDYPFVIVRFACHDCPRIGRYRLAVLAEKFGADAVMADVLAAIAAGFQAYLDEFVFRWNRRRHYRSAFDTLLGIGLRTAPMDYWTLIDRPSPNFCQIT